MIRTLGEFLSAMIDRIREAISRRLGQEPAPSATDLPPARPATDPAEAIPEAVDALPSPPPDLGPGVDGNHALDATPGVVIDPPNGLVGSITAEAFAPASGPAFSMVATTMAAPPFEPSAREVPAAHRVEPLASLELSRPQPEELRMSPSDPSPAVAPEPRREPRPIHLPEPSPAEVAIPSPEDFLKSPSDSKPAPVPEPAPATPQDHDHILSAEEEEALAEFLGGLDAKADLTSRAKESLEETLAGLKLTREEENALADEIRQLRDLAVKLDENVVEIAAFGLVSRGKSSVLNALLGREAFKTGSTHGTTTVKTAQDWQSVTLSDGDDPDSARLVLVDTPGIDEVGGEAREALARDVARHADLLLFVVSSDMQRREYDALAQLREAQKPIILVFNQIDRYPDADRDQVYETIRDERVRHLVRPDDVVMTAARPDPYKVKIRNPDGTTTVTWERPDPVIEPLKARILEVLHREGKALVALNTLLFAGDLHHEIVAHKMHIRDGAANKLIWNFCLAKGAAVGLNPIPVADMAGGLAVDVAMIVALSRAYGIALTRRTAITLVKDMVKALGALGVVEVASRLVVAGIKSTLAGLSVATGGLALFGYGAVGLAQGVTAAYTSYILGQGAKVYLQQGCQWGSKGIKTVIQQILDQAKADSVMDRLRDDLKKKVHA